VKLTKSELEAVNDDGDLSDFTCSIGFRHEVLRSVDDGGMADWLVRIICPGCHKEVEQGQHVRDSLKLASAEHRHMATCTRYQRWAKKQETQHDRN
jgi:hypothetical protein